MLNSTHPQYHYQQGFTQTNKQEQLSTSDNVSVGSNSNPFPLHSNQVGTNSFQINTNPVTNFNRTPTTPLGSISPQQMMNNNMMTVTQPHNFQPTSPLSNNNVSVDQQTNTINNSSDKLALITNQLERELKELSDLKTNLKQVIEKQNNTMTLLYSYIQQQQQQQYVNMQTGSLNNNHYFTHNMNETSPMTPQTFSNGNNMYSSSHNTGSQTQPNNNSLTWQMNNTMMNSKLNDIPNSSTSTGFQTNYN
ncbi:hypothetical protein ABK040_004389 [Willaertia magna]